MLVFQSASNGTVGHGWGNLSTVNPQLEEVRRGRGRRLYQVVGLSQAVLAGPTPTSVFGN